MSEVKENLEKASIHKVINLIGLKLSDCELNELQSGNYVSLEGRKLGEIGSIFILIEALFSLSKTGQKISFYDLPKVTEKSEQRLGIPIYYWNDISSIKYCLHLALLDSKPAIFIRRYSQI
jgi:hypothetical protein